jgi:hypothetical protein
MKCVRSTGEHSSIRVRVAVGVLLVPCTVPYAAAQETDWATYRDTDAGYAIAVPPGWSIREALPATGQSGVVQEHDVLLEGELHKVTLHEGGEPFWPGWFQVRVYDDADPAARDAWLEAWTAVDVWEGGVRDTLVAGETAWALTRWTYDHMEAELAAIHAGRVYLLSFENHNGNDPDFSGHLALYERIASSFRFLEP